MASLQSQKRVSPASPACGGAAWRRRWTAGLAAALVAVGAFSVGLVRCAGQAPEAAAVDKAAAKKAAEKAPPKAPLTEAELAVVAKDDAFRKAIDWSPWKHIAVLHKGRVKPIDSMAREYVEQVCKKVSPTLEWNGAPRKFQAAEIFYSWLVEPEKWEDVEFLSCDFEELRSEYMGLPLKSAENVKLLYASPADLQEPEKAARLQTLLRTVEAKSKRDEGYEPAGIEKFAAELARRAMAFRSVALDRSSIDREFAGFAKQVPAVFDQAEAAWNECLLIVEQLGATEGPLSAESLRALRKKWNDRNLRAEMSGLSAKGRPSTDACYDAVAHLSEATIAARQDLVDLFTAATKAAAKDEATAERWNKGKAAFNEQLKNLERVATGTAMLRRSMFENSKPLRIVPSLDPEAIKEDRAEGQTQPWLSLETIVFAPLPYLLEKGCPAEETKAVRKAFEDAKAAYAKQDAAAFNAALVVLGRDFRTLGEKLSDEQVKIAEAQKINPELLAAIRYPSVKRMETEVYYFKADPFFRAMIGYLLACLCLTLAFGPLRTPMTIGGMIGLALGLGYSLWGFSMRIAVSGYAPVTNIYETIVYVACICAGLALWFMLLPGVWEALRTGWRLTACPALPEAEAPAAGRSETAVSTERLISWGLQVPRLGLAALAFYMLAVVPYAAGGQTVVQILPKGDLGSSLPNTNNLTVWIVGWGVMLTVMYFVPRMILALGAAVFAFPGTLLGGAWKAKLAKIVEHPRPLLGLGGAAASALAAVIAWNSPNDMVDKNVQQLQPILRDNVWLTIHVMTIVASYAAGALSWGVGNVSLLVYLFGEYRKVGHDSIDPADEHGPADGVDHRPERAEYLPPAICATLGGYIYRVMQIAVVLLAAGTILGGLWADVSWGRFWGWDPKEVWALISLLAYLAVLHARYAGLVDNFGLAAGGVLGFTAIMMSWYGVNFVLGAGLHAYAFGAGGQGYVFTAVGLNWILVAAAAWRYQTLTAVRSGPHTAPPSDPPAEVQPAREVAAAPR